MKYLNVLLADAPLTNPSPYQSPPNTMSDPLIAHGGQFTAYVGAALIVLAIAIAVGFFSRRVEHALFTALALSLGVVAFFAFTR